jgi:hypothetical protein
LPVIRCTSFSAARLLTASSGHNGPRNQSPKRSHDPSAQSCEVRLGLGLWPAEILLESLAQIGQQLRGTIRKVIAEMAVSSLEMGGVHPGWWQPFGWRCSTNKLLRTGDVLPIGTVSVCCFTDIFEFMVPPFSLDRLIIRARSSYPMKKIQIFSVWRR